MTRPMFALFNLAVLFATGFFSMRAYIRAGADSALPGSRVLSGRVRAWYFSQLEPFEHLLCRLRVPAAVLSYTQILGSILTGLAYANGLIFSAGWLVLFTGTLDILDGKVARRSNGDSKRGAFLDSVIDRYAEFIGYAGLMVFFQSGWRVWAVLLALLGGMMVSYSRARAEGLGVRGDVGLLQRPERFVFLGFGSVFSSVAAHVFDDANYTLLSVVILLLAVLSNITALQRVAFVLRSLEEPPRG